MRRSVDIDPELRALYEQAIAFRLEPDYALAPRTRAELSTWNERLVALVSIVHARCEAARLGRALGASWDGYLGEALARAPRKPRSAREAARRLRDGLGFGRVPLLPARARLAVGMLGWREVLPLVFPLVAYGAGGAVAAQLLSSAGTDQASLDRSYLRAWATFGDPSFARVARELGLQLAPPSPNEESAT
jgi:hypothetical protein